MDQITERLLEIIASEENTSHKSSHWRKHTEKFLFKDGSVAGISGFSNRSPRFIGSNLIHRLLQKRNFPNLAIPKESKWHSLAKFTSKQQDRSLDLCLLRHVFTLDFLEKKLNLDQIKNVCVIGDGQANFVSLAIASLFFEKIISINLPEVLLSDWELIKRLNLI